VALEIAQHCAIMSERVAPHSHPAHANDRLGLAAALIAPLTWGLTGALVRLLGDLSSMAIVAGRLATGATALTLLMVMRGWSTAQIRLSWPAIMMAAYYVLATEAFARAPVVEVTLLIGIAPVIALGIEHLRGRSVPRRQLIGVVLALTGLVGFLAPNAKHGEARLVGDLLALGAAGASAAYASRLRHLADSGRALDPCSVAAMACLVGAIAAAAAMSVAGSWGNLAVTPRDLRMLAMLGIVSTAVPTFAYSFASARLPAVLTTSLGLSTPLFATLFAGCVIGEWPAARALPPALLVLVGLVLVVRSK
jgi:drug/metabolite transporter (DMT)-like permease